MRRLIGLSPLVHAIPLLAYLLLRGLVTNSVPDPLPEQHWWRVYNLVTLLNEFTPWFFLPLPLWLVTLAIARTKGALVATALPFAMFLGLYGELYVPRPANLAEWSGQAAPGEARLRVMTFNVLALSRPAAGLVQVVNEADPDVFLAQELTPELAKTLDAGIGDRYPYSRLRTNGLWEAQGLWSRYPIVEEERWDGSRRGANWQHAVLDVNGRHVDVVSLHLTTPRINMRSSDALPLPVAVGEISEARSLEVAWLVPRLRTLAAGPNPVIVAGDFNLTDQTPEFRRLLDAGYGNAYRQAGWGIDFTFPSVPRLRISRGHYLIDFPFIGIDHVLVSSEVQTRRAEVWPEGGSSDHRPVVVDVMIPPA